MNYYSQTGEDKIIEEYFEKNYIGGCIEVGAMDGVGNSNTNYFEKSGWYSLCVEPNPHYFKQLINNRLHSINYAISNVNDDLIFNIVDIKDSYIHQDAISSLKIDDRLFNQHKDLGYNMSIIPIIVKAITLDYCIEHFYKYDTLDFISIDTEGTELDVLKGFSIEKWIPKLLIIENNYNDPDIEIYLDMFGYKKDRRLAVNDFYIKK